MENKMKIFRTDAHIEAFMPLITSLLEGVFNARLIDSFFDEMMELHTKDDIQAVLTEMAANISQYEKNYAMFPKVMKNCDDHVRELMMNYFLKASRDFKASYESIKIKYHLKYEV